MTIRSLIVAGAILAVIPFAPAETAELKVLSAGAMKAVVLAGADGFQKQSGHILTVENDTAGGLAKRIEGGAAFDLAIISPGIVDDLIAKGKIAAGTRTNIARVGIGVMVKAGAPKVDVSSIEAFKKTLLAAKTVGYIDPASGGSSGIYLEKLFERLGIASEIKAKAKLKQGGYVADIVASGEAEVGIHQISEILPASGVTFIGPLPTEIQNYTVYAAGVGAAAKEPAGASALIKFLVSPDLSEILRVKGMERPAS